jgi:hypothetical protein
MDEAARDHQPAHRDDHAQLVPGHAERGVSSLSTATDEAGVGRTSRDLVSANGGNDQVDASALAVADYAVLVKAVANATG